MLKPGKLNVNQVILAINIGAVPTGAKHRKASSAQMKLHPTFMTPKNLGTSAS